MHISLSSVHFHIRTNVLGHIAKCYLLNFLLNACDNELNDMHNKKTDVLCMYINFGLRSFLYVRTTQM